MTKLKLKALKWQKLKFRGSVLNFSLKNLVFITSKNYFIFFTTPPYNISNIKCSIFFLPFISKKKKSIFLSLHLDILFFYSYFILCLFISLPPTITE